MRVIVAVIIYSKESKVRTLKGLSYQQVADSIIVYIQGNEHPPGLNDVIEAQQQSVSVLFDEN